MGATEYSYLWNGTEDGCALLQLDGAEGSYAIVNTVTKHGLIIEDEATHSEVIETMRGHSCRIVTPKEFSGRQ